MLQTIQQFRCENPGLKAFFNSAGSTFVQGLLGKEAGAAPPAFFPLLLEARRHLRFPPEPLQMLLQSEVKHRD